MNHHGLWIPVFCTNVKGETIPDYVIVVDAHGTRRMINVGLYADGLWHPLNFDGSRLVPSPMFARYVVPPKHLVQPQLPQQAPVGDIMPIMPITDTLTTTQLSLPTSDPGFLLHYKMQDFMCWSVRDGCP